MNESFLQKILTPIQEKIPTVPAPFVISIEGGSGTGKTTVARALQERLCCQVIHTDDFFLPPELRSKQRLSQPGGNVHYERLNEQVAEPLRCGKEIAYRVFSCHSMAYTETIRFPLPAVLIIEGVYSAHPAIQDILSFRLFLDADFDQRIKRIEQRGDKEKLPRFLKEWIPMENRYFEFFSVRKNSDLLLLNKEEE